MSAEAEHQESKIEDQTFTDYLLTGPDQSDFDLSRDRFPMREVDLS